MLPLQLLPFMGRRPLASSHGPVSGSAAPAVKAEGQDKASWLEIGAAWPNKDGKGFSLELKAMPMPGAEIVLRINKPAEAKA